ncbi:MAG TPA: TonB-dependent receptor [Candidatus Baltobacteraceae bacterium]|nr:TonB-dependent receptor [Candidatus Baltobacteraceae bacterium]
MKRYSHVSASIFVMCALLFQPAVVYAGTTGTVNGVVVINTGEAVPDATVTANSASQQATVHSDNTGRFVFLSLAPDTYVISVTKDGYDPVAVPGVSVFADQTRTVTLLTRKTLKTIANVTSQSATALVRPGTTSDVYSVDPATASKTGVLGGGGNLNNAYSAIASVPGAYVPQGQQGYGQALYIRGGDYTQIGYEYDGVPVNRSFDNYAGGSLANLGQQELQVYTGGAPAGSSAAAISGFINQVIRTGTYPGFGSLEGGIGSPAFYHSANFEAGGANPARTFSYYAGVGAYNQDFRLFDQFNGGGTHPELGYATVLNSPFNTSAGGVPTGVVPTCAAGTSGFGTTYTPPGMHVDPGCYAFGPGYVGFGANVQSAAGPGSGGFFFAREIDREAVANFHFALPHHNDAGRDDVQLLWTAGTLWSPIYTSQQDVGLSNVFNAFGPPPGHPECVSGSTLICNSTLAYLDPNIFPSGTRFGQSANGLVAVPYFQPGSPTQRSPGALVPPDARDGYINNQDIEKIQYQKNFGSNAYLRAFGYMFYSDWLINGPNYNGIAFPANAAAFGQIGQEYGASADYELSTHTRGGELQFADQLGSEHLLNVTGNYTTASTIRANNSTWVYSLLTRATNDTDGTNCFTSTGAIGACNSSTTRGTFANPTPFVPVNGSWIVTQTAPRATFNNVVPKFYSAAISDQYRPNDKLLFNLGVRWEHFEYDLGSTQDAGKNFWFAAAQREFCYDPATLQPTSTKSLTCPAGSVHPDGLNGDRLLTNTYDPTLVNTVVSPRFAMTFTPRQNTVVRFSYGRYAQPVNAAFVQYNTLQPNLPGDLLFPRFWKFGFTSPRHDVVPSISDNFDLSLEHRFNGTDVSFKFTPFYRSTENQLQQFYIDPASGFVSGLNVGHQISYGLEFQLQKGNFERNGLSALISYTYTRSHITYTDFRSAPGRNVIDVLNDSIRSYNALTSAGGGAPCYTNAGDGTPDPTCGATSIRNPYFNDPEQPLLNRSGQYYPFDLFPNGPNYFGIPGNSTNSFYVPNVVSAIVNYRWNKLAITPSFVYVAGNPYGVPLDTPGIDPRFCTANQSGVPTAPDKLVADYTTCGGGGAQFVNVPNPEIGGHFTGLGQFRNPDQISVNLGLSYDISPKFRATAVLANVYNHCFGGTSTPWTAAFPPGNSICAYGSNGFAPSPIATHGGFYNGAGPNDVAANGVPLNPYIAHTYVPIGYNMPFEVYFKLDVKI